MSYIGSWKLGDLVTFYANTHNPSNGSAQDADAAPMYHIYEDEGATPLLTGTMGLLNGSNTVGFYSRLVSISGSLGFEKGKSYAIYIQAVVSSVTGTMHHYFQIEAEVDANTVSVPVTAGTVTGSVASVTAPVGISTGTFLNAIAYRVWSELMAGYTDVNTFGGHLEEIDAAFIRNALGVASGNLDTQLTSIGDAVDNVPNLVWEENNANHLTAGTVGHTLASRMPTGTIPNVLNVINPVVAGVVTGSVLGNVNGSVGSVVSPVGINTGTFLNALADAVWDEQIAGHLSAGSVGAALNAAGSAGDPWTTPLPGAYGAGTAGHILASRMPTGTVLVGDKTGFSLSSPQAFNLIGNISGTLSNVINVINPVVAGVVTGSVLGNVNGSVNSVTQPVGISTGTFLDALADKVWDEGLSGHLTALSAGHTLFSRMPTGTVIVGQNNDKTGYSLASPQNFDLIGNISGTLSNVLNVVNPVVAGIVTGSVLGNVNGSVGSVVSPVGISTGTLIGAIADGVWDEPLAGHLAAGSAGNALNGAGSAGDPWSTSLPGSYVAGQAGHILASRMPTGTVIVSSNQDKTGYSLSSPQNINIVGNISGTFVGNLSGSVGSVTDMNSTLLNKIADFILRRPLASARASSDGDAVVFRSLLGGVSKLVNRWKISGTTLTVYTEDDTTSAGTQALTGTAGADPITEVDTNG